jgi:hypothetical protein
MKEFMMPDLYPLSKKLRFGDILLKTKKSCLKSSSFFCTQGRDRTCLATQSDRPARLRQKTGLPGSAVRQACPATSEDGSALLCSQTGRHGIAKIKYFSAIFSRQHFSDIFHVYELLSCQVILLRILA